MSVERRNEKKPLAAALANVNPGTQQIQFWRRYSQADEPADKARLLLAMMRSGALAMDRLSLARDFGDLASAALIREPRPKSAMPLLRIDDCLSLIEEGRASCPGLASRALGLIAAGLIKQALVLFPGEHGLIRVLSAIAAWHRRPNRKRTDALSRKRQELQSIMPRGYFKSKSCYYDSVVMTISKEFLRSAIDAALARYFSRPAPVPSTFDQLTRELADPDAVPIDEEPVVDRLSEGIIPWLLFGRCPLNSFDASRLARA